VSAQAIWTPTLVQQRIAYAPDWWDHHDAPEAWCNEATPETHYTRKALQRTVDAALRKLPDRTARMIRSYYYYGETYRAIGLQHGVSNQNVHQIIVRGLHKLQRDPALRDFRPPRRRARPRHPLLDGAREVVA
jgi:RNA polymerase sigma factor (sigma-70 family)